MASLAQVFFVGSFAAIFKDIPLRHYALSSDVAGVSLGAVHLGRRGLSFQLLLFRNLGYNRREGCEVRGSRLQGSTHTASHGSLPSLCQSLVACGYLRARQRLQPHGEQGQWGHRAGVPAVGTTRLPGGQHWLSEVWHEGHAQGLCTPSAGHLDGHQVLSC